MKKQTKYRSEHAIQCELIQRCKEIAERYPEYEIIDNIFAIPNGGFRNKITARAMKYEGVRPGVLDLFLAVPRYPLHGLFIEMKSHVGRLSPDQKKWSEFFRNQMYEVMVCRTSYVALHEIFFYLWGTEGRCILDNIFDDMDWEKEV